MFKRNFYGYREDKTKLENVVFNDSDVTCEKFLSFGSYIIYSIIAMYGNGCSLEYMSKRFKLTKEKVIDCIYTFVDENILILNDDNDNFKFIFRDYFNMYGEHLISKKFGIVQTHVSIFGKPKTACQYIMRHDFIKTCILLYGKERYLNLLTNDGVIIRDLKTFQLKNSLHEYRYYLPEEITECSDEDFIAFDSTDHINYSKDFQILNPNICRVNRDAVSIPAEKIDGMTYFVDAERYNYHNPYCVIVGKDLNRICFIHAECCNYLSIKYGDKYSYYQWIEVFCEHCYKNKNSDLSKDLKQIHANKWCRYRKFGKIQMLKK